MRPHNTLVTLLVGLTGHGALAAPTTASSNDAVNLVTGGDDQAIPYDESEIRPRRTTRRPSIQDMATAAEQWRRDTNIVSNFLSDVQFMTPQQRQDQGRIAALAEKDELSQKAVLDRQFLNGRAAQRNQAVATADNVLDKQGTFQFVLDQLIVFSNRGARLSDNKVARMVQAVNQDRCTNVLPSIDTYFAATQALTAQGRERLTAVRPNNCPS